MLVTRKIEIDVGHRVPNHKSVCSNLHGHRYTVEAGVDDEVITEEGISEQGMVIDFGDLKETLMILDEKYDHGFVMYKDDELRTMFEKIKSEHNHNIQFVDFVPTAENLARHFFELLRQELRKENIKLYHVKVWETPNNTAKYTLQNYEQDNE